MSAFTKELTKGIKGHWLDFLLNEFKQDYMSSLFGYLEEEMDSGKTIYPVPSNWFRAFRDTPFDSVKAVILGQDPYIRSILSDHGELPQATGLSFSVPPNAPLPPSLRNVYKNIEACTGTTPQNGDLSNWAKEGVFLLNATLTVEAGKSGSHQKKGWEILTTKVIQEINDHCDNVCFLSWGNFAHKCCESVSEDKHLVIRTTHPSPLGARKTSKNAEAFLGSDCFSKANSWLVSKGGKAITWA